MAKPSSGVGLDTPDHAGLHNMHIDVATMYGTTAADIVTAVGAAVAGDKLYFGPHTWTVATSDLSYTDIGYGTFYTASGYLVRLPSNITLYGPGTISITGVPNEGLVPPYTNHYTVFAMGGGESNIRIEGLTFQGTNSPFVAYDSNQSAPIRVYADSAVSDIEIVGCKFKDLNGFAVHIEGTPAPSRVNVRGCNVYQVGNTINNNADYAIMEGNTFTTSGGIEASGIAMQASNNTFYDCRTTAISAGGRTAVDLVGAVRGVSVTGNTINTCTDSGIVLADGIRGAVVDGNSITRCTQAAIQFTVSTGYNPTDCSITNNNIYGNCLRGTTTSAVVLGTGGSHSFIGNSIWEDDDVSALYWQQHGVDVFGTDCVISGNYIESQSTYGTAKCISVGAVANVYLGRNTYVGAKTVEIGGTATVGATDLYGRVVGDRVMRTRISNGQIGVARWDLFADGAMAWGDGTSATDATLARSAANVLSLGSNDAIITGAAVHASLPSAAGYAAGAQFYCTTDKKPVWSDGSAHWVDAAGANHT